MIFCHMVMDENYRTKVGGKGICWLNLKVYAHKLKKLWLKLYIQTIMYFILIKLIFDVFVGKFHICK
jgi:hypothetical protein